MTSRLPRYTGEFDQEEGFCLLLHEEEVAFSEEIGFSVLLLNN